MINGAEDVTTMAWDHTLAGYTLESMSATLMSLGAPDDVEVGHHMSLHVPDEA